MAKTKSGNTVLSESQVRAQAISLRNAGKTRQEVARALGRSLCWVQKWWQRYKHGDSLNDKSRPGRPPCLNSRAKDLIRKAMGRRHQSCHRLSQRLKNLGEHVSKDTVHHYLTQKLGLGIQEAESPSTHHSAEREEVGLRKKVRLAHPKGLGKLDFLR